MYHTKIETSQEVIAVIRARHDADIEVFGTYSAPDGEHGDDHGVMKTLYGLKESDYPLFEVCTTWDIDRENASKRVNEKHEYHLCIPKAD